MACGRAGNGHRRDLRDAAVVGAIDNNFPAGCCFGHFHHGDALRMLQHENIIRTNRQIIGVFGQVHFDIDVFVVDHDHLATCDVEQFHTVSVFTKGAQLASGGHAGFRIESLGIGKQRLAPFGKDMGRIAFWHVHSVIGGDGNGFEGKTGCGLSQCRC